MNIPIQTLLEKAGLPNFSFDDEGFPSPGEVIRYYREKMKYVDPVDHKEKKWTQADLARRLGLSEVTVRFMETQNSSLDSIARRRLLSELLKISPILLGLGTVADVEDFLKQHQETPFTAPTTIRGVGVAKETISLYQDTLNVYSDKHGTGSAQDSVLEIELWVKRVQVDIEKARDTSKSDLQETLCNFHILATTVYSDLCQWNNAYKHANAALGLAENLKKVDLQAASFYRLAMLELDQRNYSLAKVNTHAALKVARTASPHLKGSVITLAGVATALAATDDADRMYAQKLLEEAGSCAYSLGSQSSNERIIKFGIGKYALEKADAFRALKRPGLALETLDEAEDNTDPTRQRTLAYINILRAESSMKLKKPELDKATTLLTDAFDVSKGIKSEYNIGYITQLYKDLHKGPYGNSLQVADLGTALRQWRQIKL